MEQLRMWWNRKEVRPVCLPEGVTIRRFNGSDEDIDIWVDIAKHGLLAEDADRDDYIGTMLKHKDLDTNNIFIFEKDGASAATITPIIFKDKNQGYIHMVACKTEYRGIGIGSQLNNAAMKVLYDSCVPSAYLTTDDFRLAAIKSYITADFFPVLFADDMEERWCKILKQLNIESVDAVDANGNFLKSIKGV